MKKVRLSQRQLDKMREEGLVDAIAPGIPRKQTPVVEPEPEPPAPQVIVQDREFVPLRLLVRRDPRGFIETVDITKLLSS